MKRTILCVAIFCTAFAPASRGGVEACVGTAQELRDALTLAGSGASVRIRLEAGSIATSGMPFEAMLVADRALEISGGWSEGCHSQRPDPGASILDGGDSSLVLRLATTASATAPTAYLWNFTIANGHAETGAAGGLLLEFTHATPEAHLDRLRLVSNSSTGSGGALHIRNVAGGVVTLWNSLVTGNSASNGAGVLITSGNAHALTLLANNTIVGNSATEVYSAAGGVALGASDPPTGTVELRNNAIVLNPRGDGALSDAHAHPGGPGFTSVNNAYSVAPTGNVEQTGSVLGDPGFVGSGDFRLGKQSALIDAGAEYPGAELAPRDHFGSPRVFGAAIDIGMHEYRIDLFGSGFE